MDPEKGMFLRNIVICFSTMAVAHCALNAIDRRMSRDSISISPIPNLLDVPKKKIDKRGINKEASRTINEFIQTMNENGFDLSNFYRNFKPNTLIYLPQTVGHYDWNKSHIFVDPENVRPSLLRALLDMSTTVVYDAFDDHTIAQGFDRTVYTPREFGIRQKNRLGYGLNEGYKDVFLKRYFGIDEVYPKMSELATMLEMLTKKESLEKNFIKGNLRFLMKYSYDEMSVMPFTVKNWILLMDDVFEGMYLDDFRRKPLLNIKYRQLLIELSKNVLSRADHIYRDQPLYKIIDDNGGSWEDSQLGDMLNTLREILLRRKRIPLLTGLKEEDLEEIERYSDEYLSIIPKEKRIKLTDQKGELK